jgi:pimeloyl-ACP methyl ester carboxylesterase
MVETPTIWCERGGGDDGPVLVLLHGVGANGAVWDGLLPLLAKRWPGPWLVPDLRGHGRSFHRAPYGIGVHAADVAGLLRPDEEITLVGHSMGGAVSIALATAMFGIRVARAVAFCIKVDWSVEDLAGAEAVAAAPARLFDSREEAVERSLRVAGLAGLVAPDSRAASVGITEQRGKFRLATDPLVNTTGKSDLASIARAARVPLHLLSGEHDTIGHAEGMRRLGLEVTVLPGLGHSPHVEAPEAFWRAIEGELLGF